MQALPVEIIYIILSFISKPKDAYNFSRVNITNNDIINNPLFWKQKLIEWRCYIGQHLLNNGIVKRTSDIFFLYWWDRLSINNILLSPPIQYQTIRSMEQYKILMKMMKLITEEGDSWIKRYKPCFFIEKWIHSKRFLATPNGDACLIKLKSLSTHSITAYSSNDTLTRDFGLSGIRFLFQLLYSDAECCKFVWWRCSYSILKDTAFQISMNKLKLELSKLGKLPLVNDFYFG